MHVLIVDDSALVRQALTAILARERDIEVDSASDPIFAMRKIEAKRPDVIVLDLEMPRVDGLTFLRQLTQRGDRIPVVICSARASENAVQALQAGAVDLITKPELGVRDFLYESAVTIVDAVRAASRARIVARGTATPAAPLGITTRNVVAIGASTGGTEALRVILESMPPDAPAIVVVQHMPEHFTRAFAKHLDQTCRIEVREAEDGDEVKPGRALIARGNRHLELGRDGARLVARVREGALVSRHRPSVDVLFRSVAEEIARNAIGVLLTGMGDDGADGLVLLRQRGAHTIAQDEKTSVVFGMPKEAIARGGAVDVLPLDRIAAAILGRTRLREATS